jgi:hypothetical protein
MADLGRSWVQQLGRQDAGGQAASACGIILKLMPVMGKEKRAPVGILAMCGSS